MADVCQGLYLGDRVVGFLHDRETRCAGDHQVRLNLRETSSDLQKPDSKDRPAGAGETHNHLQAQHPFLFAPWRRGYRERGTRLRSARAEDDQSVAIASTSLHSPGGPQRAVARDRHACRAQARASRGKDSRSASHASGRVASITILEEVPSLEADGSSRLQVMSSMMMVSLAACMRVAMAHRTWASSVMSISSSTTTTNLT